MRYGNELKVGIAVIVSVIIFIVGVRYFQDIPIFSGTYELYTTFDNADGLIAGNPVRISGVNVGRVEEVRLHDPSRDVLVRFQLNEETRLPQGSTTRVSGIGALGNVYMSIDLAPRTNPPVAPGDTLASQQQDVLGNAVDRAPQLINRADTLLSSAATTFSAAEHFLASPSSDLRQSLVAIESAATTLERLLRAEQAQLNSTLASIDTLATSLDDVTTANEDSLALAVAHLNRSMRQLETNLASLEQTTHTLDAILQKVDQGQGTLGMLVNDPSLYLRLDSVTTNLNHLILDFQRNPKRYLQDLKLVDVF